MESDSDELLELGLGFGDLLRSAQCGFVDKGQVRKIEQVVADQQIRRVVMQITRDVDPVRVITGKVVGQLAGVGQRGIAQTTLDGTENFPRPPRRQRLAK